MTVATVTTSHAYVGWARGPQDLGGGTSRHVYTMKEMLDGGDFRLSSYFVVVREGYASPESLDQGRDPGRELLMQRCASRAHAEQVAQEIISGQRVWLNQEV